MSQLAQVLGANVRRSRIAAQQTQDEFVAQTQGQVSQTYLSDIERGLADNITLGKLEVLALALDTTVVALLMSDPRPPAAMEEAVTPTA